MKQKPLSELSLTELRQQKARQKGILVAAAILWFLLLLMIIYLALSKKMVYGLIAILPGMITIFLPVWSSLSKTVTELKRRAADGIISEAPSPSGL